MDKEPKNKKLKEKEKTFTEGVEDSRQMFEKEEQDKEFNPLKLKIY